MPKLRFPEFRDPQGWKKTPLATVLSEQRLKSDGQSEVHSVSLAKGIVPQIEHLGRSFAASNTSHYSLVRPWDIVYTRSPLALFKLGIVKQHRNARNAIVSPLYGIFSPINQYVGELIEAYFASPSRNLRFIGPLAQKGAKNTIQISNDRFLSGKIYLPVDEKEQRKIAECLTSLDDVITAQARKVEALKAHKRGLMQQLFPREGETVPRLRFTEFCDAPEWQNQRLATLIQLMSGVHLSPDQYSTDGEVPYFTGPSDYTNEFSDVTKWTSDTKSSARADDTLVTVKGSGVGELWYLAIPVVAMGRQLMAVRSNGFVSRFMFYLLQTKRARFEDLASGNLIPGLSRGDILDLSATFPILKEQKRIADCLSSLDDKIVAETKRLGTLRTHKTGLMQQLFPLPGVE